MRGEKGYWFLRIVWGIIWLFILNDYIKSLPI